MKHVMPVEFWTWLDQRLEATGLNDAQLAKKAEISQSVISKARKDVQPIGWDACAAIASALGVPPETVFRLAGLLDKEKNWRAEFDEWKGLFSELSADDQAELLALAYMKRERGKKKVKG